MGRMLKHALIAAIVFAPFIVPVAGHAKPAKAKAKAAATVVQNHITNNVFVNTGGYGHYHEGRYFGHDPRPYSGTLTMNALRHKYTFVDAVPISGYLRVGDVLWNISSWGENNSRRIKLRTPNPDGGTYKLDLRWDRNSNEIRRLN